MPVLAVEAGRSAAGQRAATSHTAAVATPLVSREALFEQAGVITTPGFGDLVETTALLASQPVQPAQSYEQMGASLLLSQALVDPVTGRLQRVFGITQVKIDPTFVNGTDLPLAQFTIQQQVTKQLTLTYSTPLENSSNPLIVQAELWISPEWSATALRDQYGLFSVKLRYKRLFH